MSDPIANRACAPGISVIAVAPNPSLHPTCYSRLRRLPHAGELKR